MTAKDQELFNALKIAAGKLATAADQANNVLSEEHQTLTEPFINEVRHVLEQCDPAELPEWDGTLRETDLSIEVFRTNTNPAGPPVGVSMVHLPSGIGRASESKPTEAENREVAEKSLTKAVAKFYARDTVRR